MNFIKYGDEYVDNIRGFEIISVSGRELIGMEIDEQQMGQSDGAVFVHKRVPPRDITVTYKLNAPTKEAYRIRFNQLNRILFNAQQKLIFGDEPDKYFIASQAEADGTTITFHCADPYKYALNEKVFTAADGVLTITNTGNVPCNVDYNIVNTAENGYIGLVSEQGYLEFGAGENADEPEPTKDTIIAHTSEDWSRYTGTHPQNQNIACNGTLTYKTTASHWSGFNPDWGGWEVSSYGTKPSGSSAYGGCVRFTVPNPSANFYIWFQQVFATSKLVQQGHNQICLADEDNKIICAFATSKTSTTSNTAYARFYLAGGKADFESSSISNEIMDTEYFQADLGGMPKGNPYTTNGCEDIRKVGADITFYYWGKYYTYHRSELKDKKVKYVYIFIGQHSNTGSSYGVQFMNTGKISMVNLATDTEGKAINANRYIAGSICEVNGTSKLFTVNGQPKPGDELRGSDYFMVPAGTTEVEVTNSSWCSQPIEVTAYIRERWL